mmetsp:Transcript_8725/g.13187  ORF Transcript_8725/g.13187 Transcript_8725/m.13187 type:complete len:80 (-) Transcript_8725:364-603(-)
MVLAMRPEPRLCSSSKDLSTDAIASPHLANSVMEPVGTTKTLFYGISAVENHIAFMIRYSSVAETPLFNSLLDEALDFF